MGVALPILVTPAQCTTLLKCQLPNGRGSWLFVASIVPGGFGIIRAEQTHTAIALPRVQRSLLLTVWARDAISLIYRGVANAGLGARLNTVNFVGYSRTVELRLNTSNSPHASGLRPPHTSPVHVVLLVTIATPRLNTSVCMGR